VIGVFVDSSTRWFTRNRPSLETVNWGRFVATAPPPTMRVEKSATGFVPADSA
jgi:hypothetical protein